MNIPVCIKGSISRSFYKAKGSPRSPVRLAFLGSASSFARQSREPNGALTEEEKKKRRKGEETNSRVFLRDGYFLGEFAVERRDALKFLSAATAASPPEGVKHILMVTASSQRTYGGRPRGRSPPSKVTGPVRLSSG